MHNKNALYLACVRNLQYMHCRQPSAYWHISANDVLGCIYFAILYDRIYLTVPDPNAWVESAEL